jgi:hypothetical protein
VTACACQDSRNPSLEESRGNVERPEIDNT